jgi:hypothetical protein
MVTRRNLLRVGGTALLAAAAGCSSSASDDDATTREPTSNATATQETESPTADTTAEPSDETSTEAGPRLDLTAVDASEVPDRATVGVAAPDLLQLVADAASSEGRVDFERPVQAQTGSDLALGQFDSVAFRGETYEASASFAEFAEEAGYQYSLEAVDDGEVDGDSIEYASLNESEQAIADAMLENGSYDVGHHEQRPAAAETFEAQAYLRTETATYRIQQVVGDHAAHHMLTLDAASPSEGAQVVTVADRTPDPEWRAVFEVAFGSGTTAIDVADPGSLVEYVTGVDYLVTVDTVAEIVVDTVQ